VTREGGAVSDFEMPQSSINRRRFVLLLLRKYRIPVVAFLVSASFGRWLACED